MKLSIVICGHSGTGKYNPYVAMQSDLRRAVIIGLHKSESWADLAKALRLTEDEVHEHIKSLEEGGFVREVDGKPLPNFFVALKEDVLKTRKASMGLGKRMGGIYEANWKTVVETYNKLSASSRFGLERVGFVLIGAYSLDMIGKFAEEGEIMPRAPKRKMGRYYLWGVENGMEALGRYGMHSDKCGEFGYASFGGEKERRRPSPPDHWWIMMVNEMAEKDPNVVYLKFQKLPRPERKAIEEKLREVTLEALKEYERKYHNENYEISKESEDYLRQWLYVDQNHVPSAPIYNKKDMETIRAFVDEMATYIFDTIHRNLDTINATFRKCKASRYASFPEFFCWYYHLAFTEAMDYLIRKQRISQPKHGYEFWVWKT